MVIMGGVDPIGVLCHYWLIILVKQASSMNVSADEPSDDFQADMFMESVYFFFETSYISLVFCIHEGPHIRERSNILTFPDQKIATLVVGNHQHPFSGRWKLCFCRALVPHPQP